MTHRYTGQSTLGELEAYLRENGLGLRVSRSGQEWFAYIAEGDPVDVIGRSASALGPTMIAAVQAAIDEWEGTE